ncbi:MAG: HEPN domain-containing protein, partial [Lacibacter sp.]
GTDLRYLQDIDKSYNIIIKDGVRDNIKRLLRDIESLELIVTLRASYKLHSFLKKLNEVETERSVTDEESNELKEILKEIRHTMTAEANGIFAFITVEKRYELSKLLDKIDKLFSPTIYSNLPQMAQYDFNEAGKCIAFERSTAAAFHILRATEVVVRLYYQKFLRKKPDGKTWGQLLNELKNKNKGKKPNSVTINHLFNIKDSFRNPTQHPDKIYDIQEVQDLLSVCIDVINKMTAEIK